MHGCAIGKRPTGLVHHPAHAVEELHHDPARSEAAAVGSAGLCGTGAFTGSSRPAGHIWANVFSLVRRSSQSSCVLSNWDTPKASPIALPRGSTVSGLQSAPMRGRLRLWSIVRWRPGTGSRQAAAPARTRRSRATRIARHPGGQGGGKNGLIGRIVHLPSCMSTHAFESHACWYSRAMQGSFGICGLQAQELRPWLSPSLGRPKPRAEDGVLTRGVPKRALQGSHASAPTRVRETRKPPPSRFAQSAIARAMGFQPSERTLTRSVSRP